MSLFTSAHPLTAQPPAPTHARVGRRLLAALLLWGAGVALLASLGVAQRLPTQLLPVPVALGMVLPLLVYARSAALRAFVHALDLRTLTLYNVWRVPAAGVFFIYGARGELPETFVRNAAWGDLIAGLLAVGVVLGAPYLPRLRFSGFVGFHLFSFADFVVAVGTGFAFSVSADPLMATLKTFPVALIPLFGVPVTGALSLMTLHRLAVRRA